MPHNLWQFPKFRKYHFMCCSLSYKNEHTIWTLFHTRMSTYCHTRIRTHSTNIYTVVHTVIQESNTLCRVQHNISLCLTEQNRDEIMTLSVCSNLIQQNGDENCDTLSLYTVKSSPCFDFEHHNWSASPSVEPRRLRWCGISDHHHLEYSELYLERSSNMFQQNGDENCTTKKHVLAK